MRQLAVKRLLELKNRHRIKFLDYLLHPDGYRFLIEAEHPGHQELSEIRKRYRVTDRPAIQRCLMDTSPHTFRQWYITASTDRWNSGEIAAEPWWHTALAVGSQQFCENIADTLPVSWLKLNVYPALKTVQGLQKTRCWTVNMSRKRTYEYVRSLVPKT